jgi:heptosyltransferase-1
MKIAIVKLSALGDIIHAMVALQYIKKARNDIQIDWIVEEKFAEILRNNPDIDRILTVNLQGIKQDKFQIFKEYRKIKSYAQNQYDLVIDAQSLFKSAVITKLLGGKTVGFDWASCREGVASLFYDAKIACAYDEKTIDRNALILSKPLGLEISSEQIMTKQPFLFYRQENKQIYDYFRNDKKNIIFVIGSSWESRNYPKQKFLKIALQLQENCLVIWGNAQEQEGANWLVQQADNIKAMPKMDINTLKAVIAKSDLLIGNDTGPTHMAWALNKPSVTVFGPTPVSRVYQTEINKVVKSASKVNPHKLDKKDFSIKDINEKEILEIVIDLL